MRRSRRAVTAVVMVAAAILQVAAGRAPAGAAPAAACTVTPTPNGQSVDRTIPSGSYRLYVPAGITTATAPLLLSLHGAGGSAAGQETDSGLKAFADQYKYIVAFPHGVQPFPWPTGWDYLMQSTTHVNFLRAVVADVSATWCVDASRVHADGFSMGGLMSGRLACEASDVFASISGHATNDPTDAWFGVPSAPCTLERPVAVYLSCGDADPATADPVLGGGCPGARDKWATRLACPAPQQVADTFGGRWTYSGCSQGTSVMWRRWAGLGHAFPAAGAARDQWFAEMAVFFAVHPMP